MTLSSRRTIIFYSIGLLLLAGPAAAQSVVRGTVVDDGTGRPINTVDIRLVDANGEARAQTLSNEQGHFRMEVADSGAYSLSARRVGYSAIMAEGINVGEMEDVEIEVRLSPRAIALQPVTVIAQRPMRPARIIAFQERAEFNRRIGRGRIYMRDDLDRLRLVSIQDLLDTASWGARCRPVVLLDGMPADGFIHGLRGEDIEGVELYRGVTQIPPEFYRYGMCGLALVWTRMDPPGMRPFTWKRAGVAGVLLVIFGIFLR